MLEWIERKRGETNVS